MNMAYLSSHLPSIYLIHIGTFIISQVSGTSLGALHISERSEQLLPQANVLQNTDTSVNFSSFSHNKISNEIKEDSSVSRWNPTAGDYPHVWKSKELCKRPGGNYYDNWICDPDEILTLEETTQLNNKINEILRCKKCACAKNQCRDSPAPYGKYSIAVAILSNFTDGIGSPMDKMTQFATSLRDNQWNNIQRCTDGIYLALNIGDRTYYTATGAVARVELTDKKIVEIDEDVQDFLDRSEWFNYFNEKLDLIGEELPGSCGLSGGQIAGIVIGCIAGVALIVGLIVLCVGHFQSWECVANTCAGVCIGFILGAIQAFINALIFQCVRNMCDAMGCGDCNPCEGCEPLSCVDDLEGGGGAGGEF